MEVRKALSFLQMLRKAQQSHFLVRSQSRISIREIIIMLFAEYCIICLLFFNVAKIEPFS